MPSEDVTDAYILAAALQGEPTYWFAVPKSGKPLPEYWTSANCFWMYPVEHDLARFAKVNGFHPTDSVFELDPSGVSKVLPSATLKVNAKCKRYQEGGVTYFFVPSEEVDWVEREYKALLKKEADLPPSQSLTTMKTVQVGARVNNAALEVKAERESEPDKEREGPERRENEGAGTANVGGEEEGPGEVKDEGHDNVDEKEGEGAPVSSSEAQWAEAESDGDNSDATQSWRRQPSAFQLGSHKRRRPHRGTTIYVAPAHQRPTGDHRSNEAFTWPAHFIVHRGCADYLCRAASGNTYGFRLDKVTHNGFPVFLLFGSSVNNSDEVSPTANGVPALETAVLRGEGGDRGMGNSVMILTRPPSEKHGYRRDPATHTSTTRSGGSGGTRRRRRIGMSSDEDDEDDESEVAASSEEEGENAEDDDDESAFVRRRGHGSKKPATVATVGRSARKLARTENGGKAKKETQPLRVASVNLWTELDGPVPSIEHLSKQYTLAHEMTTPLRTTVFPDGTCVTYSAASLEKVQTALGKKRNAANGTTGGGGGGAGGSTRIGGNTPDDEAIRSLLENVQLAQLQLQSASMAS